MCAGMHICIMSVLFVHKGIELQQISNKSPKYNPNVETIVVPRHCLIEDFIVKQPWLLHKLTPKGVLFFLFF